MNLEVANCDFKQVRRLASCVERIASGVTRFGNGGAVWCRRKAEEALSNVLFSPFTIHSSPFASPSTLMRRMMQETSKMSLGLQITQVWKEDER